MTLLPSQNLWMWQWLQPWEPGWQGSIPCCRVAGWESFASPDDCVTLMSEPGSDQTDHSFYYSS